MVTKSAHQESKVKREGDNLKVKLFLTTETSTDTADLEIQRTEVALPSPHYLTSTCRVRRFHLWLVPHNTFVWLHLISAMASTAVGLMHRNLSSPRGLPTYSASTKTNSRSELTSLATWCTHSCCKQCPGFTGKERDVALSLAKSLDYLTWLAGLHRGQETELGPLR